MTLPHAVSLASSLHWNKLPVRCSCVPLAWLPVLATAGTWLVPGAGARGALITLATTRQYIQFQIGQSEGV